MSLLQENVSNVRFVAWDTETTGLSARADEIVEIAAISFDEDFEHRAFQSLIKPNASIPPGVTAIHGITDAMVADSPAAEKVFEQFGDFLKWSGQPRVLVAHNASFDVGMFHGELLRQKSFIGIRTPVDAEALVPEFCIDSCQLARALIDDTKSHSLGALATYFGVSHVQQHRAMGDVRVLKEIFLKLLEMASDKYADANGLTIGRLVRLCGGRYSLHTSFDGLSSDIFKTAFCLSPELEQLSALCGGSQAIAICYDREEEWRYVTPIGIKTKNSRVYIEAFCHRDQIKKTFRGDRIRSVGKVLEASL